MIEIVCMCLAGLAVVAWPRFRKAQRRRCPACWYDLSATPATRCSECGFEAKHERQLHRIRHRMVFQIGGLLFFVGAWLISCLPRIGSGDQAAFVPTTLLIAAQPYRSTRQSETFAAALERRCRADELADWQWRWLVGLLLNAPQSDRSGVHTFNGHHFFRIAADRDRVEQAALEQAVVAWTTIQFHAPSAWPRISNPIIGRPNVDVPLPPRLVNWTISEPTQSRRIASSSRSDWSILVDRPDLLDGPPQYRFQLELRRDDGTTELIDRTAPLPVAIGGTLDMFIEAVPSRAIAECFKGIDIILHSASCLIETRNLEETMAAEDIIGLPLVADLVFDGKVLQTTVIRTSWGRDVIGADFDERLIPHPDMWHRLEVVVRTDADRALLMVADHLATDSGPMRYWEGTVRLKARE